MKRLIVYDDFLFDSILEKTSEGELPFKLSSRLITLLKSINHQISTKLLSSCDTMSSNVTLVDYDDIQEDMFTYTTSPKILNYIISNTLTDDNTKNIKAFYNMSFDNSIWKENRASIKIGRFINKIYPNVFLPNGKPGEDIESFVESIKIERTKNKGMGNFKIVEGKNVIKYYNERSYVSNRFGSTLNGSCMKYEICSPYIGFYVKNNIKLVVLMSEVEPNKIEGRALLWDLSEIDGITTNKKFLDRIYVNKTYNIAKFKELAKNNGWLYKSNQDMYENTQTIDTSDNSCKYRKFKVDNIKKYKAYPYMDTLKYYNKEENCLTNDEDDDYDYKLESGDGGYDEYRYGNYKNTYIYSAFIDNVINENEVVWSDEMGRYLMHDEAVYSKYLGEYVTKEYAEEHWTFSKKEDDWFSNDEVVFINDKIGWVSKKYADYHFTLCGYDKKYYTTDNGLPSDKWDIVPLKYVVYVITTDRINWRNIKKLGLDDIGGEVDIRYKNDGTYFTIYSETKKDFFNFDNSMKGFQMVKEIKEGII